MIDGVGALRESVAGVEAAVDTQALPGQVAGAPRSEEQDGRGNVFGQACPAKRQPPG